jgi:type II secretory pathway component GspD/PulD (secretin)
LTRNHITQSPRTRNALLADALWRFSGGISGVTLACAAIVFAPALTSAAFAQEERQQEGGWLRRAWGQVKPEDAQQPEQTQPAQNANQQAAAPQRGGPISDDTILISAASDAVNIGLLVDLAAKELDVNIVSDPGLNDQTVIFNGGLSVPRDELLTLLSMLLEQRGYAITADRPGWYVIKQAGNLPVIFGTGPLSTTRVIPTPMIRPSSLQDAVSKALGVTEGQAGRVAFIDELGVMIVTNTPRNIQAVEDLVAAVTMERDRLVLHRFELMNLSADVAREKILSLLAGVQGGQVRNQSQPLGDGAQRGAVQVGGGQSGSLSNLPERLFVDAESNAVIFRGSAAEAASLIELISVIDVPSRLIATRYPVGPAATQIAQFGERRGLGSVTSMGSSQTGRSTSFGGNFNTNQSRTGQNQQGNGSGFVVEDNLEAFVYFGTKSQHTQVQSLVDAFAEQARGARVVVEFYKLKHADAEQVAELLNALIQDPQSRNGESPFLPTAGTSGNRPRIPTPIDIQIGGENAEGSEADGAALTPTSDLSIEPDVARNQIAVRAPARQQREIAKIIEKLDLRRPQVYIEVQIVSVTANDDFRFAIESQFTPGQSVLFTNFGLTTVPPGGSATDPRVVNPALRGFTSAIIESDYVPLVINAFQEIGDTRIISSPRVLVNDNEEASVDSLREVPYAETTQNSSTTSTSQGGTVEAGTSLTVTPQISDAGMLNLTYALELSDFEGQGSDGLQPPKQTENYEGVVTLPSDATMVVGGLVRERTAKVVQQVPFIGDIPIIGEFFKSTVEQKSQATIYVFITPRIVRDPTFTDLRLLTEGPMTRVNLDNDLPDLEPVFMPTSGAIVSPKQELEPPALSPVEEPTPTEPTAMGAKKPAAADKPKPMGTVVIVTEKDSGGQ